MIERPSADLAKDYYSKVITWNGIHILGSALVPDEAMFTGAETVFNLLRYRPDLTKTLVEAGGRYALAPEGGVAVDLPEFSFLIGEVTFDGRDYSNIIGLFARLDLPISGSNVDNVLGLSSDPYLGLQNILVHEAAHLIENVGFDGSLRADLTKAFQNAQSLSVWDGTYAMSNESEYFAVASEAYFGHGREDSVMGTVNTRNELAAEDPLAFALLQKVYGNDSWRDGDFMGDDGDNTLQGSGVGDFIVGWQGDDLLIGGHGNDYLNGSYGNDTAVYSGSQAAYSIILSPKSTSIQDRRINGDGTDTLFDIEELDFNSGNFNLSQFGGTTKLSEENFESFIELYIAYFNRAPDAIGLGFWGTAFAAGTTLKEMAILFVDQPETEATYPESTSNIVFAETVYNNVLGRTPDQSGFDFWVEQLDSGNVSRDQFILEVLRGVQIDSPDRNYLDSKVDVGAYFSVHKGMSDVENAKTVMEVFEEYGVNESVQAIDSFYQDASDPNTGEFLMSLVGVLDDPFSFA